MKEFIEKLIERLEEYRINKLDDSDYEEGMYDAFGLAISFINELAKEYGDTPKKSPSGWISVEERLPNTGDYALIWCKGRFTSGTCIGEECQWYGIGYTWGEKWTVFQCKDIKNIEVIAWQPLPEPFRTEKAEWKEAVMNHFTKVD